MFDTSKFQLPEKISRKCDLKENSEFVTSMKSFLSDDDLICSEIQILGQSYKKSDLIVLEIFDCDYMTVGLLQAAVVQGNTVYFVLRKCRASRQWMRFFQSSTIDPVSSIVESSTIADYKPLNKRGTSDSFIFFLHHFLSFEYDI